MMQQRQQAVLAVQILVQLEGTAGGHSWRAQLENLHEFELAAITCQAVRPLSRCLLSAPTLLAMFARSLWQY